MTDEQPLFWYRPRSDGFYEGPIHNAQIEKSRVECGAWVPLFARTAAQTVAASTSRNTVIDECIRAMGRAPQSNSWQVSYQGAARTEMLKLKAVTPPTLDGEKSALLALHKELGKMLWAGADEGWDKAVDAVRDRIMELAK